MQAEYHIEIDDIAPQSRFIFRPDPASAASAQGMGRCDTECFQIKKIAYEAPNALFIYLEVAGK